MTERHITFDVNKVTPIDFCGETLLLMDINQSYELPFDTKPIEGYRLPINEKTGEQLPNCCLFHKAAFEGAKSWFETFPDCCEGHRKMVLQGRIKKTDYNGTPEKIVRQLSYTEHQITHRFEIQDWYKDITDYIEYNVLSFGQPNVGLQ
jgi:hypothetical protein